LTATRQPNALLTDDIFQSIAFTLKVSKTFKGFLQPLLKRQQAKGCIYLDVCISFVG